MTYILGVNAFHADSSACIIRNGEILFAIEEERINRIKHWSGFPTKSIEACLNFADISMDEIDFITFNTDPQFNLKKKNISTDIFIDLSNSRCNYENFHQSCKPRLENTNHIFPYS